MFFSFSEVNYIFLHLYSILSNLMPTSSITLNLNRFTCLKTVYENFTQEISASKTGSIHSFGSTVRFLGWFLFDLHFFIILCLGSGFLWVFTFWVHFKEVWFDYWDWHWVFTWLEATVWVSGFLNEEASFRETTLFLWWMTWCINSEIRKQVLKESLWPKSNWQQ